MTETGMNFDAFGLLAAFVAGAGIGAAYLGLLWLAVRMLLQQQRAMLFALLGVLRGLVVIGALWLGVRGGLPAIDICAALLGFVTMRVLTTHLINPPSNEAATWK